MSGADYPITFNMQVDGDDEVQAKFNSTANAAEQLGNKTEQVATKTSKLASIMKESASGLTTAATGAASLYFQYDALEKGAQRIDKATLQVSKAQEAANKAQADLNAMIDGGVTSGAEYESAVLNLTQAQDQLSLKTKDLELAQGDLTESQIGFALGIVPTVIGAVDGVSKAMTVLRAGKVASAAASIAEGAADIGAAGAKGVHTGATVAQTLATGALTVATRLLQIAMGPVGWIILGVSAAAGAFATNFLGMRDAVNAAGKAIGDAVPILKPLLDTLGSLANAIFPETKNQAASATEGLTQNMELWKTEFDATSNVAVLSLGDVSDAFTEAQQTGSTSIKKLETDVDKSANKIVSDADRIKAAMKKIGASFNEGGAITVVNNIVGDSIADPRGTTKPVPTLADLAASAAPRTTAEALNPPARAPIFDVNRSAGDFYLAKATGGEQRVRVELYVTEDGRINVRSKDPSVEINGMY